MVFENLDYTAEVAGDNSALRFPTGKHLPVKVYTFVDSNKNHMFQLFAEGVVVLTTKYDGKTVFASNRPLTKIDDTTIDIDF